MAKQVTATDIIDSVTDAAIGVVEQIWGNEGVTGTRDQFAAAVLRVQPILLERHLAELDAREPGKAAAVRQAFLAEQDGAQA